MGQLFVDTWESQGDIDEATLLANNIYAIFMRLNDMNGGHHMDTYFLTQWEQAKNMLRVPYFVYNPWVTGQANFDWLLAHMPPEARALAIDIEVVYTGYSSTTYAQEVAKFYNLCKVKWNTVIYTGEWFLQYLAYWPTDANYWWAQYPNAFYPAGTQYWTWDTIRNTLIQYPRPFNESRCPGKILMWQFTGDRLILPGSPNKMDVNTAFMTEQEFTDWCGGIIVPPVVIPPEPVVTHIGVTVYRVTRFGAPVIVQIIDPTVADVWVSGKADDFQTVLQTVTKNNASGGVNGGGWNYAHPELGTNEYWKSRGTLIDISVIDPSRPWMGFTTDKKIVFGRGVPPTNTTDVVGFDRYLGENGVFNETYRYYKTKDARTFSGATSDNKLILCVCQGNDATKNGVPPYGLTFLEEWEVLKEFGCVTGGNNDGGSSTQVINKALGSGDLITPSDGSDAYVINAILFNAAPLTGNTYIEYPTPELWRLKSVIYVQGADQNDIDQMGCGFAPVYGGFSGVNNWIELNQAEINLIERSNTGLDSISWVDKRQYAVQAGKVWIPTLANYASPWHAQNIVIGSKLPYGSDWNVVKVLGRSSNGYYFIEGIPSGADLTQFNRNTHPWLFHRINVTSAVTQTSTDTPKGKMILPIFSPVGRRHAAGDVVATGIWIKPEYLHSKITEVPPMTTPFDVKITGVPKYYLGKLIGYNDLNIREGPSMFTIGKVGYLKPYSISQTLVEVLELVANAEGYFGKLGKNMWIALYLKSTGKYYTDWRPPT